MFQLCIGLFSKVNKDVLDFKILIKPVYPISALGRLPLDQRFLWKPCRAKFGKKRHLTKKVTIFR